MTLSQLSTIQTLSKLLLQFTRLEKYVWFLQLIQQLEEVLNILLNFDNWKSAVQSQTHNQPLQLLGPQPNQNFKF